MARPLCSGSGLTRRWLLAGLAAAAAPARAQTAPLFRPRPQGGAVQVQVRADGESSRIGFATPEASGGEVLPDLVLPSREVSLAGRVPLAGRELLVAAFALTEAIILAALIGWDGSRMRVLGLEPAVLQAPEGLRLSMRLNATPDGKALRLVNELSAPRGPTLPFHDHWIDLLGFRPLGPLTDLAARPPMAGGGQARLSGIRTRVLAVLEAAGPSLSADELAATGLAQAPHQLALAVGAAAYPADMADP